jgi:hypothetical protein
MAIETEETTPDDSNRHPSEAIAGGAAVGGREMPVEFVAEILQKCLKPDSQDYRCVDVNAAAECLAELAPTDLSDFDQAVLSAHRYIMALRDAAELARHLQNERTWVGLRGETSE